MTERKTREQLQEENAVLRDLLAAIAEAADLPHHADPADESWYNATLQSRADLIAVYADMTGKTGERWETQTFRERAALVRERVSRPLRYKAKTAAAEAERS